jgi:AraC-like DNA-binding protein
MLSEAVNVTLKDFRIKTRSIANYTMSTHHFHDGYEVYYLFEGSRNYFINDTTYPIDEGSLVLIRPYDLHKTMDTGTSHSRILLSFHENFLPVLDRDQLIDTCFGNSKILMLDESQKTVIESLLNSLAVEARDQKEFFHAQLQANLIELLIVIARFILCNKKADDLEPPANQKIFEIIQYLKHNYNQPITLDSLSKDFYTSPFYLTRLFKKTTGFTLFEYIHSLRIIQAQFLLRTTNHKVIYIAQLVGFNHGSNFGKIFKSLTGVSPLNYRKQQKNS